MRKNPEKLHPGKLSRPGIEPGAAAWQARMLPLVSQRWTQNSKVKYVCYAECKKGMLQGLVVGRCLTCDYILLINFCSKTFPLDASVSEMWRRMLAILTRKARKGAKVTVEILSLSTILFTYRRCSMWSPPTSIHFVYHVIMPCRTLEKIPSISWKITADTCIRATRSCCVSTWKTPFATDELNVEAQ